MVEYQSAPHTQGPRSAHIRTLQDDLESINNELATLERDFVAATELMQAMRAEFQSLRAYSTRRS